MVDRGMVVAYDFLMKIDCKSVWLLKLSAPELIDFIGSNLYCYSCETINSHHNQCSLAFK